MSGYSGVDSNFFDGEEDEPTPEAAVTESTDRVEQDPPAPVVAASGRVNDTPQAIKEDATSAKVVGDTEFVDVD